MNDVSFLKELIARGKSADDGYFEYVHLIACELPNRLREQLEQLVNGPVADGDVVSKNDRNELIDLGLAMRVCLGGHQGHTGAPYIAQSVIKRIHEIRTGAVGA